MYGSDTSLLIEPTTMGFSVIKIEIPENSTVVCVCATVTGAEELEIYMWQKDPTGFYSPTLLVQKKVRFQIQTLLHQCFKGLYQVFNLMLFLIRPVF